jgi:hypothetical protein
MPKKQYPPHGKKIMLQRQAGRIPSKIVMVVFNYYLGRAYPHIVITENTNPETLEFSYLSGIPVQIVFCSQDAHRVDAVVQAILAVNPLCLSTFALDLVDTGKSTTFIKPLPKHLMEEQTC